MDETPLPPAKQPVIPLPDLPQPSTPPAGDGHEPGNLSGMPPAPTGTAGVNVRVRVAEPAEDSETEAGSIAPFNTRIIAVLIDVVVATGLQISAWWLLPGFAERMAWIIGLAYLVTRDSLPFLGGQSVGKKAMKLKAVTLEGKALVANWEAALIRNGVLIIPFFFLVELYVLLSREGKPGRGIRLGDEWAKTQVIIAEDPPAAAGPM